MGAQVLKTPNRGCFGTCSSITCESSLAGRQASRDSSLIHICKECIYIYIKYVYIYIIYHTYIYIYV